MAKKEKKAQPVKKASNKVYRFYGWCGNMYMKAGEPADLAALAKEGLTEETYTK